MFRQFKKALVIGMALMMSLMTGFSALADEQIASGTFSDLRLDSGGSASWTLSDVPEGRAVEYYRVSLARLSNGSWRENYRTVNVKDESSYEISFSSTGVYKFKVRARYYGGEWTAWSDYSPEVTVTRDDVDHGGWDSGRLDPALDIVYNNNKYGNYGPGYENGLGGSSNILGGPGAVNGPGATGYGPGIVINRTEGWIQNEKGWWYRFYDGSYPANGWYYLEDQWYYFNADGYRVTGWVNYNNDWYYLKPEGPMGTGWQFYNEKWYYLNDSGVMQTGYLTEGDKTYYLGADGARFENKFSPEGHYFGSDGVMVF